MKGLVRRVLVGLGAAVVVLGLAVGGLLEPVELAALSRLFEVRGPRSPAAPIVIVAIDEDTFDELNLPWPFPRALHGELLDRLASGRALAIGLDILFPEPSRSGARDDEALGAAVARAGNVVMASAVTVVGERFYTKVDQNPPVPAARRGAAAVAPINLYHDADGQVRRSPLRLAAGPRTLEGFDAALHRVATQGGLRTAPLPAGEQVWINFRGRPGTFPRVPYHAVLRGEVPPKTFAGKIVLVGLTSPALHDVFRAPFAQAGNMPGVEIHANVLDTLVRGDGLGALPAWAAWAAAAVAAVLGSWLVGRLRALRALGAAALLWLGVAAAVLGAFALADTWVRGVGVTLGLVLGYTGTVVENFVREQRERRRLSRFFSPAVLRAVVRGRDEVSLSSSRRLVTVLFSDLRGFTSISEKLEPEQVAEMLEEYLSAMTEIVFKHGGTVDKYIGDCVMALYNVPFADPDHMLNAVRTALEFQERTLALSGRWEERLGVVIRNGVGINTGEAVVGTLGSRQRLEYTAVGDTVNLAARLEALTKEYGASVIVSETTYEGVKGRFPTRELGAVTVRGKTRPVKIYAVSPADVRKHPRVVLDAAATVTVTGEGWICQARTRDISEGGLALVGLPEDWGPGRPVQVRLEGGELVAPIAAEGRIAWRRGELAGVTFTAVEPESAPAVAEYVARRQD